MSEKANIIVPRRLSGAWKLLGASSVGSIVFMIAPTLVASCKTSQLSLEILAGLGLLVGLTTSLYIVWLSLEVDFSSR